MSFESATKTLLAGDATLFGIVQGGVYTYGTHEVQQIALVGSPTGGTFTLTYQGQTTAPLAHNATAGVVQSALQALSTIGSGSVLCAGGPLPATPVVATFQGALAAAGVRPLTANGAVLTGGTSPSVLVAAGTGRLGLSRDVTPGAWLDGFLRPTVLVKGRNQLPFGGIMDEDQQFSSVRQVVEVWLYNDGDAGYAALETARVRIYKLLQLVMLAGGGECSWSGDIDNLRDPELDYAVLLRADYVVNGSRASS